MAKGNGHRPATLDHLAKKKPLERTVPIVLNDDVGDAVQQAEARVREMQADYEAWLKDMRDLQVATIKSMPLEAQKEYLLHLPDPPGAESRRLEIERAKEVLSGAKEAFRDATVYITVRAVGRKPYEDLVAAHPATDEQNAEHMAQHNVPAPYNGDTFPQALISASAIEPKMPLDVVNQIWDEWNSAELTDLFTAALVVNTQRRSATLGNA